MSNKSILILTQQQGNIVVKHLAFWLIYLMFLTFIINFFVPIHQAIERACISGCIHIMLVYTNLQLLFPTFFLKKRYLYYVIGGAAVITCCSLLQFALLPPLFQGLLPSNINDDLRHFGRLAFSLLSLLMISNLYAFVVNFLKNEQRKTALQRLQYESELKFLKAQLNPHFLFNTLNNIYSLCHLKDDNAAPMVMKLSSLMRYMLYDCQAKTVSLQKEINFLRDFVELQKLKTDWEQQIEIEINGELHPYQIAPLIFLPFLENLAKHSDLDSNTNAQVHISLHVDQEGILQFKMQNSIRSTPSTQMEKSGIGLDNLQKRLQLYYPQQYDFQQTSKEGIYNVELHLQLKH